MLTIGTQYGIVTEAMRPVILNSIKNFLQIDNSSVIADGVNLADYLSAGTYFTFDWHKDYYGVTRGERRVELFIDQNLHRFFAPDNIDAVVEGARKRASAWIVTKDWKYLWSNFNGWLYCFASDMRSWAMTEVIQAVPKISLVLGAECVQDAVVSVKINSVCVIYKFARVTNTDLRREFKYANPHWLPSRYQV